MRTNYVYALNFYNRYLEIQKETYSLGLVLNIK